MRHPLSLLGIVACTFLVLLYPNPTYIEPLVLAADLGGVLISVALWVRYSQHRSFDFLEPIHVVTCILLCAFCGVLVYDPSLHLTVFAETGRALSVSIIATLAFVLGYTATTSSRIPPQRLRLLRMLHRVPRPEAQMLLLTLWLLTFCFRILYSLGHGYGTVFESQDTGQVAATNLIRTIGNLGRYFIFSALIIWLSRSRRFGRIQIWLALTCLGLEVWVNLIVGWKVSPVLLIMGLLLVARARSFCGKRIGIGTGLVAGACLLLFVGVFYALDTYRSRRTLTSQVSITALTANTRVASTAGIQGSIHRFMQRVGYGGYLADVVGAVDSGVVAPERGATLWPGFFWFIPRAIWHTKPLLGIGGWWAVTVLGWGPDGGSAAVTVPGDLYLNFGVVGVFGGMLAYGLLLRFLYDRFVTDGHTVLGQCLFVPIFLTLALLGFERNLSAIIGEAGQLVCALATVLVFLTTRPLAGSPGGQRVRGIR